ncbi:MAG: hypothetical protein CMJ78_14415 [Planctomycetaceae bacterium]|nr:hypothetical protein [Planctomycetaceae bacterium]
MNEFTFGVARDKPYVATSQDLSLSDLTLASKQIYFCVSKVASTAEKADVSLRVFTPDEEVDLDEPTSWTLQDSTTSIDSVNTHRLAASGADGYFLLDEIRIGSEWPAVTNLKSSNVGQ